MSLNELVSSDDMWKAGGAAVLSLPYTHFLDDISVPGNPGIALKQCAGTFGSVWGGIQLFKFFSKWVLKVTPNNLVNSMEKYLLEPLISGSLYGILGPYFGFTMREVFLQDATRGAVLNFGSNFVYTPIRTLFDSVTSPIERAIAPNRGFASYL